LAGLGKGARVSPSAIANSRIKSGAHVAAARAALSFRSRAFEFNAHLSAVTTLT
jgi:hypothetical protein